MKKQETYWSFKAPDLPELSDLPQGTFAGTEAGWNSLSPGYRREIHRSAVKRASPQPLPIETGPIAEDAARLERADALHRQAEVQIAAREAL